MPTNEEDPYDLDVLMSKSGDELKKLTDQDIDRVIAYQRKMRGLREAGVRTKKPKDTAPSKLDISALLKKPAIGSSIRRRA